MQRLPAMIKMYSLDRYSESWIEVSSQPSSSSLSSAAPDEANPAALGVQFDQHGRRRRRLLGSGQGSPLRATARRSSNAGGSSQDEYEESESESDRIMTSSNENIERVSSDEPSPQSAPSSSSNRASEEDDEDENATALGNANNAPAFTPPANAFSHPHHRQSYVSQQHARSVESRTSYFPPQRPSPLRRQSAQSYPDRGSSRNHTPYNIISSTQQTDHDAALRASLSTLLSCAAAARGLPKNDNPQRIDPISSNQVEPSTLRLVPESALPGAISPVVEESPHSGPTTHEPPPLPPRTRSPSDKAKRKASPSPKEQAGAGRSKKKARANSPRRRQSNSAPTSSNNNAATGSDLVYPTLMTWAVGAGVVIIFSAIGFSAGYVIGREVGRVEAGGLGRQEGVVCGREVGRGLRRLRWGSGSGGLSVIRT